MKTVKEVSVITGVSIRTLRYYDEIGLLKPTELTETGYRLYDNKALEKLQEILFFRELEIPLIDIKKIMDTPNYDKEQILKVVCLTYNPFLITNSNSELIALMDSLRKNKKDCRRKTDD